MRVLIVGQGGREHALAASLARDPGIERLYAAPGNAGIAGLATCVPVAAADVGGLVELAEREDVDLTVVGPEAPLVAGLVDELAVRGRPAFGPTSGAARIEGSKAWARALCERHGIPSPGSRTFDSFDEAREHVLGLEPPVVVKADGLAAGKGVTVAEDVETAVAALHASLVERRFGRAGERVVVEEFLEGREVSVLAITDGRRILPLPPAQDHKRVGDGDTGPNTGGMGAYSPVPFVDDALGARIRHEILEPVVRALEDEGAPYRGVLYAGLMLTDRGPRVLEFNCRFGDPETQAILPRLGSGLAGVLAGAAGGDLGDRSLDLSPQACVSVVLASAGYPGEHRTGLAVDGLGEAEGMAGVSVFHAGTALRDGRVVTAGGRVVAVSAIGDDLGSARDLAYEACSRISFEGVHYRRDVAARGAG